MGMSTLLCHTKDIQAGRTPSADSLGHTLEASSLSSPWTHGALLNGSPWWTLAGQAGSHSTPLIPCEQIRSSPLAAEMDCLPHPHPPLTALIIITCPGGEARGRGSDNSLGWDPAASCQGLSPPLHRERDNAAQHRSGPSEAILSQKRGFHPQKGVPAGGDTLEIPEKGENRKIGMPEVLRRKTRPAGGRMIPQWNHSCSEGWEAALGSGITHRLISRQQFSSEVLGLISEVLSLFLFWLHHDILIKVSTWEKKSRKELGRLLNVAFHCCLQFVF